jgi:hypothetical protein
MYREEGSNYLFNKHKKQCVHILSGKHAEITWLSYTQNWVMLLRALKPPTSPTTLRLSYKWIICIFMVSTIMTPKHVHILIPVDMLPHREKGALWDGELPWIIQLVPCNTKGPTKTKKKASGSESYRDPWFWRKTTQPGAKDSSLLLEVGKHKAQIFP